MQVFKFRLRDNPELFHHMAVDTMDAILDICELFDCEESDIISFEPVEKLSARKPRGN